MPPISPQERSQPPPVVTRCHPRLYLVHNSWSEYLSDTVSHMHRHPGLGVNIGASSVNKSLREVAVSTDSCDWNDVDVNHSLGAPWWSRCRTQRVLLQPPAAQANPAEVEGLLPPLLR